MLIYVKLFICGGKLIDLLLQILKYKAMKLEEIQEVLATLDPTAIHAMYKRLGHDVSKKYVLLELVQKNAPNIAVYDAAYRLTKGANKRKRLNVIHNIHNKPKEDLLPLNTIMNKIRMVRHNKCIDLNDLPVGKRYTNLRYLLSKQLSTLPTPERRMFEILADPIPLQAPS